MNRLYDLTVRPYQLLCLVCAFGENDGGPKGTKLKELLTAIRDNPDVPLAICCNAGEAFRYQDPGTEDDSEEGAEFNIKRDMDILLRLDLTPGIILPARIALARLLTMISSTRGICSYDKVTSEAWRGCEKAKEGCYEKGRAKGIDAIIPPRKREDMKTDKQKSLKDMYEAKAIRIRPHILWCAVAQYGDGVRPPFAEDNLPEMMQYILKNPDTLITLVPEADWMMCAPCPWRVPKLNICKTGKMCSAGLYNVLKDLNVLQALGLKYGDTMKAVEFYKLTFKRVPKITGVCALEADISRQSLWRDFCGALDEPCPGYEKGRKMLMKEFNWK